MVYPKIPLAQSVIELCKTNGIQHIIISPGSRNAPLTIGFTNNPFFTCYSIVDERCAAFFAMGIAQQLQKPTALVCTSGSAILNYYPAVAEAFYSQIPLVVLSADRPANKIDIGDGQTIRQENVLEKHTVFNANLSETASKENDILIQKALQSSINLKGPVHINVPFEEPLYETLTSPSYFPFIQNESLSQLHEDDTIDFSKKWQSSLKKVVLIGAQMPNELSQEVIDKLANDPTVSVWVEKNSNTQHPTFIDALDTFITPLSDSEKANFKPNLLVSIGGMLVSKRIKKYFRDYNPSEHWHIDTLRAYDTFGVLTAHVKEQSDVFFKKMYINAIQQDATYALDINKKFTDLKLKRELYLSSVPYSDFMVYNTIAKLLPFNSHLQSSNSAAIRYFQLIDLPSTVSVFCNRGTSGIDGSTSTAIGAAVASSTPTVLVTGDISFFYDSNGLWNNYIPSDFKIILVNNQGGGIFRILPGHKENKTFDTFFETQHHLQASHLCKMYDVKYDSVVNEQELLNKLPHFMSSSKGPSLLEIITPTALSSEILLNFFKKIT